MYDKKKKNALNFTPVKGVVAPLYTPALLPFPKCTVILLCL